MKGRPWANLLKKICSRQKGRSGVVDSNFKRTYTFAGTVARQRNQAFQEVKVKMSIGSQQSEVIVRLERSVLIVPASNWTMIQKAANSRADAVCIDLEDAVAPPEKEASRANVARAFKELDF